MSDKIKALAERFLSLYDAKQHGEMVAIFMFAATLLALGFAMR